MSAHDVAGVFILIAILALVALAVFIVWSFIRSEDGGEDAG